jgi:CheY-like chemotaxis protein
MSLAPVNKKILIVDDQDSTRKLLRLALKETTLTIIEAAGAVEALTMAKQERPAVVLLDIVMPGSITGFQVCEMIKGEPELQDAYIILISGLSNPNNFYQAERLGADAYLVKPFPMSRLVEIVGNYQELKRLGTFIVEGRPPKYES